MLALVHQLEQQELQYHTHCWYLALTSKVLIRRRLARSASRLWASAIFCKKRTNDTTITPDRCDVANGKFHCFSLEATRNWAKPCAYEMIFESKGAWRIFQSIQPFSFKFECTLVLEEPSSMHTFFFVGWDVTCKYWLSDEWQWHTKVKWWLVIYQFPCYLQRPRCSLRLVHLDLHRLWLKISAVISIK